MLHIVFVQLAFIARIKNNFVELAAVADRYLIITHVKIKESEKWPFRMSLPVIKIPVQKISTHLIYNVFSLSKISEKTEAFSWRKLEYELAAKYLKKISYGEDLLLSNDVKSGHL